MKSEKQDKKIDSKVEKEETAFEGKWLGMKYLTYSIGEKVVPNYESVYRTTKKNHGGIVDGVQVLPIIQYIDKPSEIILIANFRPPVNKFVIEFPSGLLENDNYEENAKRQTLEQTGYEVAEFVKMPLPQIYSDPWKSNESNFLYIGLINGSSPRSHKMQNLEHDENIRVHRMILDKQLPERIEKLAHDNNYALEGKVWAVCVGLMMSKYMF